MYETMAGEGKLYRGPYLRLCGWPLVAQPSASLGRVSCRKLLFGGSAFLFDVSLTSPSILLSTSHPHPYRSFKYLPQASDSVMSDHESWDDFSDEEEVPLSQNAHRKSKDPSEYRIKGALKVPHLVSYTAQSLFGGSLGIINNYTAGSPHGSQH